MRFLHFALVAAALSALVSCSDSNGPTQPLTATVTPPAGTATPTPPVAATPTPTPPAAVHNVEVGSGGGNVFRDSQSGNSTTTVRAGETVTWNFVNGIHSTTSGNCCAGDGIWNSGTKSSGTFTHTFASAGTFPYFCSVHGAMMTGTVVVNP